MKKLLGILVLGLLWCNVASAKIIIFEKCGFGKKKFEKAVFEKNQYKIDTSKNKVNWIRIHKDSYLKSKDGKGTPKVQISTYDIKYFDDEYVIAEGDIMKITLLLKTRLVQIEGRDHAFNTQHNCN